MNETMLNIRKCEYELFWSNTAGRRVIRNIFSLTAFSTTWKLRSENLPPLLTIGSVYQDLLALTIEVTIFVNNPSLLVIKTLLHHLGRVELIVCVLTATHLTFAHFSPAKIAIGRELWRRHKKQRSSLNEWTSS